MLLGDCQMSDYRVRDCQVSDYRVRDCQVSDRRVTNSRLGNGLQFYVNIPRLRFF